MEKAIIENLLDDLSKMMFPSLVGVHVGDVEATVSGSVWWPEVEWPDLLGNIACWCVITAKICGS